MLAVRKRIFEVIETASENDRLSNVYDIFMMVVIIASIVSLCFKAEYPAFVVIDRVALVVFIIDYALRLFTADFKMERIKRKWVRFLIYPFTPMALIDLVCILTGFSFVSNAFKVLKVFRLIRTLRVLRLIKAVRYSKSIQMLQAVFVEQKRPLFTVGLVAVIYILVSAIVIFNIEPESFDTFFDAVYWATISLTTVGYGDIYPVSVAGRAITMISSVFGIGIIALPSGIITAGFIKEMERQKAKKEEEAEAAEEKPVSEE